jgi:succinylglutamate desuccinylase
MIQFLKANAVLLALVVIILFQQNELKQLERTLNYIYAVVQANSDEIQATKEEVWSVSDLIVAVYEEEAAAE